MWEGPSHVVTRFLHGIVPLPAFPYFGHPFRDGCTIRVIEADADAEQEVTDVTDVALVAAELDGFRSAVSALSSLPYRLRGAP